MKQELPLDILYIATEYLHSRGQIMNNTLFQFESHDRMNPYNIDTHHKVHYTTQHYTTQHYTTQHYTTLHYTTQQASKQVSRIE